MPFNGSGVFTRAYNWVNDAALSINITASRVDADSNDIANGLSNCITRDGQGVPSATISWNSQRLTDLATAVQPNDAISLGQSNTTYYRLDGTNLPVVQLNANSFTIINVSDPVNPTDAMNKQSADASYLKLTGASAMTGSLNMGGNSVTNAGAGVGTNDLVTYAQLSAATGTSSSTLLAAMNYYAYNTFFGV